MMTYVTVAVGGALGGALRHALGSWADRRVAGTFPWGTLLVNVTGCLAAGFLAGMLASRQGPLVTGLLVGVCGSYTTVSAFSLQTLALLQQGRGPAAAAYAGLSVAGCLAAAAVGLAAALPAGSA